MGLLRAQPVLVGQIVGAILSVAIAFGAPIDDAQKAALIGLVVVLATLFIHQAVVSPATVIDVAGKAAMQTAETLSGPTAGAVGTVTKTGTKVVTGVVNDVVKSVGGLVGTLAGEVKNEAA